MKRELVHSVEIAAPPRLVFGLIEDPQVRKLWQQGLEETVDTFHPAGGGKVGSRFVSRIREGGRLREYPGELIAYEAEALYSVRMDDSQYTLTISYSVVPQGPGTRAEFITRIEFHSWFSRLMSPIARLMLGTIMKNQLRSLKELAETDS